MKRRGIAALCAFCLLLGGCTQANVFAQPTSAPPYGENQVPSAPPAPEGDKDTEQTFKAIVYYFAAEDNRLEAVARDITVRDGRTRAEALILEMLERPAEDELRHLRSVLPEGTELVSIENTGDIATVNLSAQFFQINEPERQFMAHTAITNTLTENISVRSVVILGDGRESGIRDIPFGAWQRRSSNHTTDWSALSLELEQIYEGNDSGDMSIKRDVVLYFSSKDGKYLIPEMRANLSFRASPESYAAVLLDALIKGPSDAEGLRGTLSDDLAPARTPTLEQGEEGRMLTIYLPQDFYENLADTDTISDRIVFGSIVLTMFNFIPGLESIFFMDGEALVTRVGDLDFEDGRMRRADFAGLIGRDITLYAPAPGREKLASFTRSVGQLASWRPRTMLRVLVELEAGETGPQRIFPHGTAPEDILGVWIRDDRALINFSAQMALLCQGISATDERLMIYSIVNSVTELPGVNRVRFYVDGEEIDFLGGHVYMRGDFLRNTGMVD